MKNHIHSLNKSPAKQKFSFGKASRFQPYKPQTDLSYLPKPPHDRRSAVMGSGQRSVLVDKSKIYYPHSYGIPSTIENRKGFAMKSGRHQFGDPLPSLKVSQSVPGPGYSLPSTLQKKGASFKSRLSDLGQKYIKSVPGPGAYSIPTSLDNGEKSVFDSKYYHGGSLKFVPKQRKQLDIRQPLYQKKDIPGPGSYDVTKYGISNPEKTPFKKEAATKFGREYRHSIADNDGAKRPGPGSYDIYSQFEN